MDLKKGKQLLDRAIYSLESVKLKTLKTYIKTNPKKDFIQLSKSLAEVFILFGQKSDNSLKLFVNYQSFNNLIIKK